MAAEIKAFSSISIFTDDEDEESTVADLGDYIETCYYGDETDPSERRPIFKQGVGYYRPQLRQDRTNRIIIYPGVFNPPHRAHQAMVHYAFSCSQDIDAIAVIVIPVSDRTSNNSSNNSSKKYVEDACFTMAQRVRLWSGDNGPHDWLWVYDQGGSKWDTFRRDLTCAIQKDGFILEFVYLSGPDRIGRSPWDCDNIIVSNVGREADFVIEGEVCLQLDRYGSWKRILYRGRPHPWEAIKNMPPWLLSSLALIMQGSNAESTEKLHLRYIKMVTRMRVCWNRRHPNWWIRCIPASDSRLHMSSTDIRYIIKTCPPDELLEKLKGKALHPEILVQCVEEFRLRKSASQSESPEQME
ncbi:hypothetical protein F5Y00DRAFT_267733 [Daldinia vernicosa]|uniref:uncharacterized protein n=1 Tax=Daldinia vernicosa TaxID=114800 RepID=UPI0020085388|nr:uncharacterized protein F5Y00DRAFT_267733 [Daldinia vernicosa]KAI0851550.1 hypothetical protein F5Y00DRAFT_267733 [Daldinia vernicosa]